jgi:diadenosine tetraphosphate (Ap4A) HIT family hydrolase
MSPHWLDSRLLSDSVHAADLRLCQVRLQDDARFPWLVLIPQRPDLVALTDLDRAERAVLIEEIAAASRALEDATDCGKINVGALGNIVRQLHIHIVGRNEGDAAWPGPVWGSGERIPYTLEARDALLRQVRFALGAAA